jgi:hypothetical protein
MSNERRVSPRMTEPLQFKEVDSPPRYARSTEKPVRYVAVADRQGMLLGYLWINDEDDAAGWKVRRAAGDEGYNKGSLWVSLLHDAKARGLAPSAALAEMIEASDPTRSSHIVAGPPAEAAGLDTVVRLADQD